MKVLIVDGDFDFRLSLDGARKAVGAKMIHTVENGEGVLSKATRMRYDLATLAGELVEKRELARELDDTQN